MPSSAFKNFEYNIVDVDRLIESHQKLHDGNPGKKGLGHITRSGVLMLCASWELYVELLLREAGDFLISSIDTADQLPVEVQRLLGTAVRSEKHELAPLRLAGDGWRKVYAGLVEARTDALHTPKSNNLIALFNDFLGVADVSKAWSHGVGDLDKFITVRGEIAHRGRDAPYVPLGTIQGYRDQIREYATETDNFIAGHLKGLSPKKYKPWNLTQ